MEKILQNRIPTRTAITDTNPRYWTNFATQLVQEVDGDQQLWGC